MIIRPRAVTYRYRVGRAHALGDRAAGLYDSREFRTLAAAEAYQAKLAAEGLGEVLLQVGVLQWLPHAEAEAELQRLYHAGAELE